MNDKAKLSTEINYGDNYSEEQLFEKIKKFAKKAGIKVIYAVLLLYYTLEKKDVPVWAKSIIIGSLGYFIFPLDIVPDLMPATGFVDDFGLLCSALFTIAIYIDYEVKEKARKKLKDWFGNYDENLLDEVESKFKNNKR